MKKLFFILLSIGIFFTGCKNQADNSNNDASDNAKGFFVKDKSQYDPVFLDELTKYEKPVKVIDNFIVVEKDTIYFPKDLQQNKRVLFTGKNNKYDFNLEVARINYTTVEYQFLISQQDDDVIFSQKGKAVLNAMFFLDAESDEDAATGEYYGSYEYSDNSDNCRLAIRIGIGFDADGKQRAKVQYVCNDKGRFNLSLEECPVLRSN